MTNLLESLEVVAWWTILDNVGEVALRSLMTKLLKSLIDHVTRGTNEGHSSLVLVSTGSLPYPDELAARPRATDVFTADFAGWLLH
jgi:hypothetical protein